MIKTLAPIILASCSEIRKKILESSGIKFDIVTSNVDEDSFKCDISHLKFTDQAYELAKIKCSSVSILYPDKYVLAADQICALDDENVVFNKPITFDVAKSHLCSLRGKTHSQNSGMCLMKGNKVIWEHRKRALIKMRKLTDEEIEAYLNLDKPYKACGAYQLECNAKHLFEHIEGEDDNILGLPLVPLLNKLYNLKIISLCG